MATLGWIKVTLFVLIVPPDASVTGFDGNWYMGLKGAELRCESGGNPKPNNFTWTRYYLSV